MATTAQSSDMPVLAPPSAVEPFAGPDQMRALHRTKDWSTTALGSVEHWPASLRALAATIMAASQPMFVWWGPQMVQLFNDAYRPSFGEGDRHVRAVGASGPAFWMELWDDIGTDVEHVLAGRGAVAHRDRLVRVTRNGTLEDMWWSYSLNPVFDDALRIAGVLGVCEETTDRVLGEREHVRRARTQERERDQLARLFDQSPSFLAVLRGPENVFEIVNAAYERIIGGGRAVLGKPLFAALPETRGQGFDDYLAHVRATGQPLVFRDLPVMLAREPGVPLEQRFLDITYLPLVEADGTHDAVIAHGSDVTEQVRARRDIERLLADAEDTAQQLAASEAAARRALDEIETTYRTAPVGLAVLDADLRYLRINARLAEINGLPVEAHLGRTVRDVLPELAEVIESSLRRVLETGVGEFDVPVSGETPAAPGVVRHWREQWLPLRDGNGVVVGLNLVAEEVTAQHHAAIERDRLLAEAQAARAEADLERRRLLAVLEHLPVGVHVAEAPSGRLLLDNAAVRRICGEAPRSEQVADYSADYAGHYPPGHPKAGEPLASDAWPMARTLATGEPVVAELIEVRRGDGTQCLASVTAVPVRDADGRVVGAVATSIDVTERERLLLEAEQARRDAEAANRAKSDFLAVMSHELRTPLNAIDGYAELMELGIRGPITDEQRQDLARIRKSERHLLGLINGVLNYAQVEAGAIRYDMADVLAEETLLTCEVLTAPQVRLRGLTLQRHPCEPGLTVRADREKLQQVLLNLLSNAIKFSEPGGRIDLRCEATDTEGGPEVCIHVDDTGIGIPATQLTRIFEPFVQVNSALTRTREGTGLGLAISRDLARGMGGDLTAASTPGVGSTFTLTLPRA